MGTKVIPHREAYILEGYTGEKILLKGTYYVDIKFSGEGEPIYAKCYVGKNPDKIIIEDGNELEKIVKFIEKRKVQNNQSQPL